MPDLTPEKLLDLAEIYALDALDDDERRGVVAALAGSPSDVRRRFDAIVVDVRETMAGYAVADAVTPPAHIHATLLTAVGHPDRFEAAPADEVPNTDGAHDAAVIDLAARRRRRIVLAVTAAAAAVLVAIGGIGLAGRLSAPAPAPGVGEQVMAAPDMQTASSPVPGGGRMTVMYSRGADAAVVVLNEVRAPAPGTSYQMWQVPASGAPQSVGVMDAADLTPSTRVALHGIDTTSAVAVSVEPAGGSASPTRIVVSVPLTR